MSQHVISLRTHLVIYAVLMVLLFVTIGVAYIDLRQVNAVTALVIATTKAVLIILYFMHVKFTGWLTKIFASAAFLWLGILIAFSLSDYLTRNWLSISGK